MLTDVLNLFRLVKIDVTLQLQADCTLPSYKGSMWHGWLGHAIKSVSNAAFEAMYIQHDHEQPKPYAIQPGENDKTEWNAGELISFGITLYGSAIELLPLLLAALKKGESLGIGQARTPCAVVAVDAFNPSGLQTSVDVFSLTQYVAAARYSAGGLAMLLSTPLRIKHKGKVLHNAQDLCAQVLASQVRRRLLQLTRYWVADSAALSQAISSMSLGTNDCQLNSVVYFEDWQRFSLRQQEFLPYGGFKGVIRFEGDLAQLHFWLHLGQLLQLGGKTTFGLGCYRLVSV